MNHLALLDALSYADVCQLQREALPVFPHGDEVFPLEAMMLHESNISLDPSAHIAISNLFFRDLALSGLLYTDGTVSEEKFSRSAKVEEPTRSAAETSRPGLDCCTQTVRDTPTRNNVSESPHCDDQGDDNGGRAPQIPSQDLSGAPASPCWLLANPRGDLNDLVVGRKRYDGQVCSVFVARTYAPSRVMVSLKCYPKTLLTGASQDATRLRKSVEQEIMTGTLLQDCAGAVRQLGYFEDSDTLYIVHEYADGGNVLSLLEGRTKNRLNVTETRSVLLNVVDALHQLHANGLVHGAVCPQHIFMCKDLPKLGSFRHSLPSPASAMTPWGTTLSPLPLDYTPPELLGAERYLSASSDMWCVGVLCFQLLCGYAPFEHPQTSGTQELILGGAVFFPSWLPVEAKRFIGALLSVDASERPSAESTLQHPFLVPRLSPPPDDAGETSVTEAESTVVEPSHRLPLEDFVRSLRFPNTDALPQHHSATTDKSISSGFPTEQPRRSPHIQQGSPLHLHERQQQQQQRTSSFSAASELDVSLSSNSNSESRPLSNDTVTTLNVSGTTPATSTLASPCVFPGVAVTKSPTLRGDSSSPTVSDAHGPSRSKSNAPSHSDTHSQSPTSNVADMRVIMAGTLPTSEAGHSKLALVEPREQCVQRLLFDVDVSSFSSNTSDGL